MSARYLSVVIIVASCTSVDVAVDRWDHSVSLLQVGAYAYRAGHLAKRGDKGEILTTHRFLPGFEEDLVEAPPRRELPTCSVSNLTGHCLPNYMVIGVQKSGTSTLWKLMGEHEQIETAESKEMFFFNGMFGMDNITCDPPDEKPNETEVAWYLDRFPQVDPDAKVVVGEFTATYLHCWCCPQAFRRVLPNVRLIAQLRDPIERAKSRWREQHNRFNLIPTYGSFDEYIDRELPILSQCIESAGEDMTGQVICAAQANILGLSLYDASIKLWLSYFPQEDILITYLEQFATTPLSVLRAIEAHLGVANFEYGDDVMNVYNPAGNYGWENVTNATALRQVSRSVQEERLRDFYHPHVIALKEMADAGQISQLPESWVAAWQLE